MTGGGEHNTDLKKRSTVHNQKTILSNKDVQGSAAKTSNQYRDIKNSVENKKGKYITMSMTGGARNNTDIKK